MIYVGNIPFYEYSKLMDMLLSLFEKTKEDEKYFELVKEIDEQKEKLEKLIEEHIKKILITNLNDI